MLRESTLMRPAGINLKVREYLYRKNAKRAKLAAKPIKIPQGLFL